MLVKFESLGVNAVTDRLTTLANLKGMTLDAMKLAFARTLSQAEINELPKAPVKPPVVKNIPANANALTTRA